MKRSLSLMKPFRPFLQSEQGSAMPFIALGVFMLMGATGTAIDMGRIQIVQTRMQNALDAAGLAVGSEISTVDVTSETSKYFYANFPVNYMGTQISNLSAVPNADNSVIALSVTGTVATTFMKIFGLNSVTVSANSQITRQSKGMELVLVMDNTGSMSQSAGGSTTKIQAAKSAANTLLDILYGTGNASIQNLWVGVVPFAQAVNIGTGHPSWMNTTYNNSLNWGTTSWMGCVEARTNGSSTPQYDISDDPPDVNVTATLFKAYYSSCNTNTTYENNAWFGTNSSRNNCLTGSGLQYKSGLGTSLGPNYRCSQAVQPLVAEKATIVTAINNMAAVGNTHINLGMAWAWRMLSPRWRGMWGGEMDPNGLPQDYNTPLMTKAVVLMTDGDNTLSGTNSAGTTTSKPGLYTAYGFTGQNWMSLSGGECTSGGSCTAGEHEMDNRTSTVCANMKAQGIVIYTVALGTSFTSSSLNMLSGCATKPEYAFVSPTTNELHTIFQQIGDSLANLRISQ